MDFKTEDSIDFLLQSCIFDNLRTWFSSRSAPSADSTITIFSLWYVINDIILEKADAIDLLKPPQYSKVTTHDSTTQKAKSWTELNHLMNWSARFLSLFKENKSNIAAIELLRCDSRKIPISLAKHHIDEALSVVSSVLNFDFSLSLKHPYTTDQEYAVENVAIDDSNSIQDILKSIYSRLCTKCLVRLLIDADDYHSALVTYVIDLMHQAGATNEEIEILAFNPKEVRMSRLSSLSLERSVAIATVFMKTDTFAAAHGIIESYYREQCPNLIVFVEEAAYDRFVKDWQRYFSHAVYIGSRLDERATVVESFNSKVKIDLDAIDVRTSQKMDGDAINILKFRNLSDLQALLGHLKKVDHMTIWNDDVLLSREFCLRLDLCNEFWINHIPKSLAGSRLFESLFNFYSSAVLDDATNIYNSVYSQYSTDTEHLRKVRLAFLEMDAQQRAQTVIQAYTAMVTKGKSLKNGLTVHEAVARLKRFHQATCQRVCSKESGQSRIETIVKPVGLAILLVRDESSIKSKAVLVELIFKNLLLDNAVFLVCPPNTLGARFSFDNDHVIPFKMVHDALPDISRLSLENSMDNYDGSSRKKCPGDVFTVEVVPDMNSETCEALTVALGCHRKSIWYPDGEQINYWSN